MLLSDTQVGGHRQIMVLIKGQEALEVVGVDISMNGWAYLRGLPDMQLCYPFEHSYCKVGLACPSRWKFDAALTSGVVFEPWRW
jgi:hypothetical protein